MNYRAQCKVNPRLRESLRAGVVWQVKELRILRDQVDSQFLRDEKRQFASEGASGGSKWAALSPKYKKAKQRKWGSKKIMQASGKTRKAFTTKGSGHVATYGKAPRPFVEVGANSDVAAYHIKPKSGLPNPLYNRKLPDRDVMQMTQAQVKKYIQIVREFISEIKGPRAQKVLAAWRRVRGGGV